jgi:predicted O-methyltransferase YrrM
MPALVARATELAGAADFQLSCHPEVGRLLAVLAGHLPRDGRVLELGTGAGVGTSWIVSGLQPRTDVSVVTIERDPRLAAVAAQQGWPGYVKVCVGNALDLLDGAATFDLIFADAMAGKWKGLDQTLASLKPGGLLVVDDMNPAPEVTTDLTTEQQSIRHAVDIRQQEVRRVLLTSPNLVSVEMSHGSGVILAAHRR